MATQGRAGVLRLVRLAQPAFERGLVYGGNGLLLLALASAMHPADLGLYFSLQAMLELAVLVATANSGTWISVNMGTAGRVAIIGFITRLWPVALLALLGVAAGVYFVSDDKAWVNIAAVALALAVYSGAGLLLALVRGRGHVTWFVVEPSFRALIAALVIAGLWLAGGVDPHEAILVNTGAAVATAVMTLIFLRRPREPAEGGLMPQPETPSVVRGTLSGVALYIARKGDILLLVPVLAAPQLAAYKVAFLLAELPLQVFQVVINRRLGEVAAGHNAGNGRVLNVLYLSYLRWAAAWAVVVGFGLPFVPIEGVLLWFGCLAIAQGLRGVAMLNEIGYLGTGRYNVVSIVAASVALVKLIAIVGVAYFVPQMIFLVPVLAALWELAAYTLCFRHFSGSAGVPRGSSKS